MGSTATYRAPGQTDRDWYQENVFGEKYEIVECATVGSVFYAAVRNLTENQGADEGQVWAYVSPLTRYRTGDGMNFGWRDDDETVGPWATEAPTRVLDALTTVEELYGPTGDYAEGKYGQQPTWVTAIQWRSKCRINAARQAARPKIKQGDTIRLAVPYKFGDGVERDTFTKGKGRGTWTASDGMRVKLPQRRSWPDYEVLA